jgi:hypothetical protein
MMLLIRIPLGRRQVPAQFPLPFGADGNRGCRAGYATLPGKLSPQMIASGSCPAVVVAAPGVSGRIALVVLGQPLDVRTHQGPITAGPHERDDFLHHGILGKFVGDPINSIGEYAVAEKERAISVAQPMQRGARGAATAQADNIEPCERSIWPLAKPNGTMLLVTPLTPPTMAPSPMCTN